MKRSENNAPKGSPQRGPKKSILKEHQDSVKNRDTKNPKPQTKIINGAWTSTFRTPFRPHPHTAATLSLKILIFLSFFLQKKGVRTDRGKHLRVSLGTTIKLVLSPDRYRVVYSLGFISSNGPPRSVCVCVSTQSYAFEKYQSDGSCKRPT